MNKRIILSVTNDLVTDQRVNKIASTLVQNGNAVTIVGRRLKDSLPLQDKSYKQKRMKLFFTKGALFYAEFNLRLCLFLLFAKADVFTANDLDTLLGVSIAGRIKRKKVVYDSHEYFTEVPELINNPKAKSVWESIEEEYLPKVDSAMTVCQSIANIYQEKYGVPFSVVRNVPNYSEYPPITKNRSRKQIIYQGAVNIGRGLELMIDALPMIYNVELLVIGGGDVLEDLKKRVESKGLSDRVTFTGKLPYEALRSYTLNADLGMSLEENMGLNYYYALPNKLFDYIQCQVPVIASDLPEIRRIVMDFGIGKILEQRTPERLAEVVSEMLTDEALQKVYKENASKASKELNWEKETDTLLKVYSEI